MMSGWIWLYFCVIVVAIARLLVPPERWRELFVSAFLGGFVLTFPVQYLFEVVLGAWTHHYLFFPVMGLPVWLAVVWFAETLIFLHYLPGRTLNMMIYTAVFALAAAGTAGIMLELGIRPFLEGWDVVNTFILAFILHCAVIGIDYMVRGGNLANRI